MASGAPLCAIACSDDGHDLEISFARRIKGAQLVEVRDSSLKVHERCQFTVVGNCVNAIVTITEKQQSETYWWGTIVMDLHFGNIQMGSKRLPLYGASGKVVGNTRFKWSK